MSFYRPRAPDPRNSFALAVIASIGILVALLVNATQ